MAADMTDSAIDAEPGVISFEAFGVSMWVATNRAEARHRLPELLPPGWRPAAAGTEADAKHRLAILGDERGTYAVDLGGYLFIEGVSLDVALDSLERIVRMRLALDAQDRIFVHAGVVGHAGGAMLIPGLSFTGKTTLVAALVRAGATYYSDEYAALDDDGFVHPFHTVRLLDDNNHGDRSLQALGGAAADPPLPVHAIVMTTYRPGNEWAPKPLSTGQGALQLLAHAVPARDRPTETVRAITRAARNAILLEGDRGEADSLAPLLLAALEARAA
jgi:hypothetical protein